MAYTRSTMRVRSFEDRDRASVIELVEADRMRGQPPVSGSMLADALAGRSRIDAGWWAELDHPVAVDVIVDAAGVSGVVSYARRSRDGAGLILWLHGREQPVVVAYAVDHALAQLTDCPVVDAFEFATALSLGLEALPVGHRPATTDALRQRGFQGRDLWRYMHRSLPIHGLPTVHELTVEVGDPGQEELKVLEGGQILAEATIGVPVAGIGVLWWICVEEKAQGRGLGKALLGSALDRMVALGAKEVILYVDDDEPPGGERDRSAANHLYEAVGFIEVDRLHSFRLSR